MTTRIRALNISKLSPHEIACDDDAVCCQAGLAKLKNCWHPQTDMFPLLFCFFEPTKSPKSNDSIQSIIDPLHMATILAVGPYGDYARYKL